jgi:hypothetical protein
MVKQQYDEEYTRIFYQCVMGASSLCPLARKQARAGGVRIGSRSMQALKA